MIFHSLQLNQQESFELALYVHLTLQVLKLPVPVASRGISIHVQRRFEYMYIHWESQEYSHVLSVARSVRSKDYGY